jgi:hypothetical protein
MKEPTLKQKIDAAKTLQFRRQLVDRRNHGEIITAGGYYLYFDGMAAVVRKCKPADVNFVRRENQ